MIRIGRQSLDELPHAVDPGRGNWHCRRLFEDTSNIFPVKMMTTLSLGFEGNNVHVRRFDRIVIFLSRLSFHNNCVMAMVFHPDDLLAFLRFDQIGNRHLHELETGLSEIYQMPELGG